AARPVRPPRPPRRSSRGCRTPTPPVRAHPSRPPSTCESCRSEPRGGSRPEAPAERTRHRGPTTGPGPMAGRETRWRADRRPCPPPPATTTIAAVKNLTVSDVMTRPVLVARAATPVKELARLMVEHRVSALPVLDDD